MSTIALNRLLIRELSLIMTGSGWKRSCRGLKLFQQICWGMKLLINIWLGSQTNFQLKEHVFKQVFCLNCPLTRVSSVECVSH